MITLKKLSFKGIGRFIDTQEISFDDLSNLIQIDGKNNNTGGSSGSGKSTVFNALDFLFGLNSIPNSALQSRITDETMLVRGEFDLDGKSLVISRGKKLSITIDGEVTTGSAKITEEKLDQILSIPRYLFRPMLHKKQREPGFFLSFTPAEMNGFLTDCLGLSNFKSNIDKLDERIVDLSKMITSLELDLGSSNAGLKASRDAILALGPAPVKDVDQTGILILKNHFELANAALSTLLDKHKSELSSIESRRPQLDSVPFDSITLNRLEKELNDILADISRLRLEEREQEHALQQKISDHKLKQSELGNKVRIGLAARDEATKHASEILKIRNSTCPRCEQSWVNDAVKTEEARILDVISALKNQVLGGEHAAIQLEAIQDKFTYEMSGPKVDHSITISGLEDKQKVIKNLYVLEKNKESEHLASQQSKNSSKLSVFAEEEKLLRQMQYSESTHARGQVDIYRRSFEASVMKLKSYEDIRSRYESSLNTLKSQECSYVDKISSVENSLADTKQQLEEAEELKRGIKSYLSCSFDEALDNISENATKMIQNIPNMANATIQLEGTKETKDGKVKEEVNSIIHMDGEENIPIKTLSGGERAAVDIAIDIAVLGLIEDRTNKGINIYILDEPFTGLDGANIEMVLEVLKNANTHKKLIVVDHNPVVKEQISDRITIVRDGLTSKVTQN